jgi:hypothetical protein
MPHQLAQAVAMQFITSLVAVRVAWEYATSSSARLSRKPAAW